MSMMRSRNYFQLGFRENKLDVTKQNIFQVNGREIKVAELVHIPVGEGQLSDVRGSSSSYRGASDRLHVSVRTDT